MTNDLLNESKNNQQIFYPITVATTRGGGPTNNLSPADARTQAHQVTMAGDCTAVNN
jgi:hypothetical protein